MAAATAIQRLMLGWRAWRDSEGTATRDSGAAPVAGQARAHAANARLTLIDAWRGVAILSVMVFHFTVALAPPFIPRDIFGFDGEYPTWLETGRYGVQLFFVISGLVISMTLTRSNNLLDFVWKRFVRIYPAFFAAVSFTFLAGALIGFGIGGQGVLDYLTSLLMVAPHLGRTWVDPVYWSLLVEIKFYAIVAASFAVLGRRFWIGVVAYAAVTALIAKASPWGAHWWLISDELPFFLLGMAAWFECFERRRAAALSCLGAGLALYGYYNFGFSAACLPVQQVCMQYDNDLIAHGFMLATAGLMLVLLLAGVRQGWAPLAWLGRISYSLYLMHDLVGVYVIREVKRLGGGDLLATSLAMPAALVFGALLFHLVEKPTHALLKAPSWLRTRIGPAAPPLASVPAPAVAARTPVVRWTESSSEREGLMQIVVFVDVACPWSYIATQRLQAALAGFEHRDQVSISWRTLERSPTLPEASSLSFQAHLTTVEGMSAGQAEGLLADWTKIGAADGVAFQFDSLQLFHARSAHQLLHFAEEQGLQGALLERMFQAGFAEGRRLDRAGVLVGLAAEVGLDPVEAEAALASQRYLGALLVDQAQAMRRGIYDAPHMIFADRLSLPGAVSADLYRQALETVWAEIRLAGAPAALEA